MSARSDNFNRANETPLAAPWFRCGFGTFNLVSNAVQNNTATDTYYGVTGAAFSPAHYSQAVETSNVNSHDWGPAVRVGGAGHTGAVPEGYFADVGFSEVGKHVNGAYTSLSAGGWPTGYAIGQTFRVEAEGTTIRTYQNGSLVRTVTDASLTGGQPGIFIFEVNGGIDTWQGGDLPLTSPSSPAIISTTTEEPGAGSWGLAEQYQRTSFSGYGLDWVIYASNPFGGGVTLNCVTSSDGGGSWSGSSDLGVLVDSARAYDLFFDGTYLHLAIGTTTGSSDLVYMRGTPDTSGGINWDAAQTVEAADGHPKWEVSISCDLTGLPWISWENWTGGNPTPRVSGSSTGGGVWTSRAGHPMNLSDASTAPFVTLCWTYIGCLDTSGKMIVFFWYDSDVYCRVWNGTSWGAYQGPIDSPSHDTVDESIAFVTNPITGVAYAAWNSASDAVVHVGVRSAAGVWSVENPTLSDGALGIALGMNRADNTVQMLYVPQSDTTIINYAIRLTGGTWSDQGTVGDAGGYQIITASVQITERPIYDRLIFSYQADVPFSDDNLYAMVWPATANVIPIPAPVYVDSGGGGGPFSINLTRVVETDTARALTRVKSKSVARVTETQTVRALTHPKSRTLTRIIETSAARALSHLKVLAIGRVTETSAARALTRLKSFALARITETNAARTLGRSKFATLGRVTETQTSRALTTAGAKFISLTRVTETQIVRTLSSIKKLLLARVLETNAARTITPTRFKNLVRVTENNAARSLAAAKKFAQLQRIIESDLARALTTSGNKLISVLRVTETNAARALARSKQAPIARVTETETVRALSSFKVSSISRVIEVSSPRSLSSSHSSLIARVIENGTARPLTFKFTHTLGRVTEVNIARPIFAQLKSTLGGPPQRMGRVVVAPRGRLQSGQTSPGRIQ